MNPNIDFMRERKELDGLELPENDEFETSDNKHTGDTDSNNRFTTRGICTHITTVTNRTLREGTRVSAIMYKETEDAEWEAFMLRPIQVGAPRMGALGELDAKTIGEGEKSPHTVMRIEATLAPVTDDLSQPAPGLMFTEVDIREGQTTLPFA